MTVKNVHLTEKAVYNQNDIPNPNMENGAPFSGNFLVKDENSGIAVKTITIDNLNIPSPISFIKVGVQGGAKETILKNKPVIIFEFEQPVQYNFKTNFNNYIEFVRSINYKFDKIIGRINYLIFT